MQNPKFSDRNNKSSLNCSLISLRIERDWGWGVIAIVALGKDGSSLFRGLGLRAGEG